ncbi:MAG: hypothetical protein R6U70_04025 [Bacillota bacterium]
MTRYYHPILLPLYAVLFLYSHNVGQVSFRFVVTPLIVVGVLAVVSYMLVLRLVSDAERAAPVTSLFWVLFFSFGRVHTAVTGTRVAMPEAGRYYPLLILWAVVFVLITRSVLTTSRDLRIAGRFLNIVAALLLVITVGTTSVSIVQGEMHLRRHGSLAVGPGHVDLVPPDEPPDIYYLVLDGYPSGDTLEEIYGYDNSAFIESLRRMGFYVADESRSNYPLTMLSLPSSLNMRYLDELQEVPGEGSRCLTVPRHLVQDNVVAASLRTAGYSFAHFNSGWGPTIHNSQADVNYLCGRLGDEFTDALVNLTPLGPVMGGVGARNRVVCVFSRISGVREEIPGPRFVFAHILPPHPPYLFDRHGEPLLRGELEMTGDVWKNRDAYLEQLRFVNERVTAMIGEILENADGAAPVIIVQSDHGTASLGERREGGWMDPDADFMRERTSILNAYHVSEEVEKHLHPSITPVNSFRILFREKFSADLQPLPDTVYFCCYWRPYRFTDVTDLLR